MIYTVTFNPAIDYVMRADNITFGITNRSEKEEIHFGGKGINVSMVLAELGADTEALGFTAGFTGEALENIIAERGIKTNFIRLKSGFTRINVKLKGEAETEINAAGPEISAAEAERLFDKLDKIQSGDTLVLAGSVPRSLPLDIYEKILDKISGRGVRVVVDAAGELLLRTLKYKPFLIKPNRQELEEIAGQKLNTDDELLKAAEVLKNMGAQNVLVSLGERGALLLDENCECHRQTAFKVEAVNTVGSGDSMIAGFLVGAERNYAYALKLGAAAGAATASLPGLATKEKIMSFLK